MLVPFPLALSIEEQMNLPISLNKMDFPDVGLIISFLSYNSSLIRIARALRRANVSFGSVNMSLIFPRPELQNKRIEFKHGQKLHVTYRYVCTRTRQDY